MKLRWEAEQRSRSCMTKEDFPRWKDSGDAPNTRSAQRIGEKMGDQLIMLARTINTKMKTEINPNRRIYKTLTAIYHNPQTRGTISFSIAIFLGTIFNRQLNWSKNIKSKVRKWTEAHWLWIKYLIIEQNGNNPTQDGTWKTESMRKMGTAPHKINWWAACNRPLQWGSF